MTRLPVQHHFVDCSAAMRVLSFDKKLIASKLHALLAPPGGIGQFGVT